MTVLASPKLVIQDPDLLLTLANTNPTAAAELADACLIEELEPSVRSTVHRAQAISRRKLGDQRGALEATEQAIYWAATAGDPRLAALGQMTRAPLCAHGGDLDEAFALLAQAEVALVGIDRAELHLQRAGLRGLVADHANARSDFDEAVTALRRTDRRDWLAEALMGRGVVLSFLGDVAAGAGEIREASALFQELGDELGVAEASYNMALVALIGGDPARSVVAFERATNLLDDAGFPVDLYRTDQCEALLAAGLNAEAIAMASRGIAALDEVGNVLEAATQRLVLAQAHFRSAQSEVGRRHAERARDELAENGQAERARYAELLLCRFDLSRQASPNVVAATAIQINGLLRGRGQAEWRSEALLVAASAYVELGDHRSADSALAAVARNYRSFVQEIERLYLAARIADGQGRSGSALRHLRRAMRTVQVANTLAGTTALRGSMSRHLEQVVNLGVRLLCASRRGRAAFTLIEQSEFRAEHQSDAAGSPLFAEHRGLTRAIADALNDQRDDSVLRRRRRMVEGAIQTARAHLIDASVIAVPELIDDATVRRYFVVDDSVWAFDASEGRVRAHELGSASDIQVLIDELHYRLRESFRAGDGASRDLVHVAAELDEALGVPGDQVAKGRILQLIAAVALPTFPLGVLPSLRSRPWLLAETACAGMTHSATGAGTALIAGSGLDHASHEVGELAALHPGAVVLENGNATCAGALAAMDGAALAHVSAHSTINTEHPMFSAIAMDDGDLYLHELETIARPPRTVVLASCDSARSERLGTNAIGLATGLLAAGIGMVIGTGCAIPDNHDTVAVMARLHASGVAGNPLKAVYAANADPNLSNAQKLIAQCLMPCVRNAVNGV